MGFDHFSSEEVLDGLFDRSARAASTTLFAIESRTAYLAARAKQVTSLALVQGAVREQELKFLEALALGQALPWPATVQDLETFASQWASLVPENPRAKAALAHLIAGKYALPYPSTAGIRAALQLDSEEVRRAYQQMYSRSLDEVYTPSVSLGERLHWGRAKLARWVEALPPFWTVFSLTLTETVGAGILALPIALAKVGPLAGVAILILLGLVNMVTIACMAEAVARNGKIRYGNAFLGQLVHDYLGGMGSFTLSAGLITMCVLTLWSLYIGFARTLADATPLPAHIWCALLFLAGLYFIRRETLDATIVSALLVGAVNLGLILILALLVFYRLRSPYLQPLSFPAMAGSAFDPSIVQLIFGVILLAYFGHMSVSNCAQTVLRRDPDSRPLLWGSVAAQLVVMLIYCLWVLAVNGAVDPRVLAAQTGTSLAPLAAAIGPAVHILGSIFVILGMGIGTLHSSIPLYNLVRERLPDRHTRTLLLPCRRGCLRFRRDPLAVVGAGRDFQLALSYLGLRHAGEAGQRRPHFGLEVRLEGRLQQLVVPIATHWEINSLFGSVPGLQQAGVRLVMDVLDSNPAFVRLRTHSPLHLVYDGEWTFSGLSMADVFALPDPHQGLIVWLMREETSGSEGKSLPEVAAQTGLPEIEARVVLNTLAGQGFVEEILINSETRFFSRLVSRRSIQLPNQVWQALIEEDRASAFKEHQHKTLDVVRQVFTGKTGRFLLSVSPVAAVFLLTEWLLMKQRESFTEPLNFLGLIVISLLGGIFPVLLLIASRRKGEIIPGVVYRLLGNPFLLAGIYLLYLAGLFLHGFLIWEDPGQRIVAILAGSLVVGLTVRLVLQGSFAQRLVVELRQDQKTGGGAVFHVVNGGQAVIADIQLSYREKLENIKAAAGEITAFGDLSKASFDLSLANAREIKIWVHRITPEGNSMGLPGIVKIHDGSEGKETEMKLSDGQAILPVHGPTCRLIIDL